MKLGRIRSVHDDRTLRLDNYLAGAGVVPAAKMRGCSGLYLPRRRMRCCIRAGIPGRCWPTTGIPAAPRQLPGTWSTTGTEVNGHLVLLTEQDVVAAYQALSAGAPQSGISMLEALKYWRNTGIGDHKIHSFAKAKSKDPNDVKCVVHLFGSCYVGLELPNFAYPNPLPADLSTIFNCGIFRRMRPQRIRNRRRTMDIAWLLLVMTRSLFT